MYTAPLYNEIELQRRLAQGDDAAFESLYRHYKESVRMFLLRYVKVPELVEDISQEIFSKIWECRDTMVEVSSFRAYLFTAARNHTLNFLNRAAKIDAAKGMMMQYMPVPVSFPEDDLITREYRQWLNSILGEMTPQMRQVFQLVRQEYKSYDEVAAMLGISRNTVKKHMVRSMKIIRSKLDDELGISFAVFLLVLLR